MRHFELQYQDLVRDILTNGELRETRNSIVKSIFGASITLDLTQSFPILNGRKVFYEGVLGEFCAMLRGPKNILDFKKFKCNYWDLWAKENGDLNLDYGNLWKDFSGINQIENVINSIKNNPTDRRMIVSGWDPSHIPSLSLPCCHYAYQWYVRDIDGVKKLDMLWHQRSTDVMIGLPSDMVFAAIWLIAMASYTDIKPGRIIMTLGDSHIYEEHFSGAYKYLDIVKCLRPTEWEFNKPKDFFEILPEDFKLLNYNPKEVIKFKLKE